MAHDALHLRLVLVYTELRILLLDVLYDLPNAALALALEFPAARKLDATAAAGLLGRLAIVLGDVDPRDRDFIALLDVAVRDELELVGGLEEGPSRRVARVRSLKDPRDIELNLVQVNVGDTHVCGYEVDTTSDLARGSVRSPRPLLVLWTLSRSRLNSRYEQRRLSTRRGTYPVIPATVGAYSDGVVRHLANENRVPVLHN